MADPSQLSSSEWLMVAGLVGLMIWEFLRARAQRLPIALFRPTLIVSVILLYYTVLGPLRKVSMGEWFDRGIDRRPDLVYGWVGAFVFFAALLVGFYCFGTRKFDRRFILDNDPERLYRLGTTLCQIGLAMFAVVTGTQLIAQLNPFTARELLQRGAGSGVEVGALGNYFRLALNFLVPGIALIWTNWVATRRHLAQLLIWLLLALGMFTTAGFRWRIVVALVPLLLLWYLVRLRRPNLVLMAAAAAGLLFMAGFIGLTRQYGRGLDTSAVEDLSTAEIFDAGYGESAIFLTTSGMMAITPERNPFVGAQPIISTLLFPIPSALMPEKDSSAYLQGSIRRLFNHPTLGMGSALLCYGEWFLMAGWPSLIAMSMLMGWLLRCLWNWYLLRLHEPMAHCCYAVAATYLYVVISRGYMPQVLMLFAFTVAPLFWLYGRWARPAIQHRVAPAAPSFPRG